MNISIVLYKIIHVSLQKVYTQGTTRPFMVSPTSYLTGNMATMLKKIESCKGKFTW